MRKFFLLLSFLISTTNFTFSHERREIIQLKNGSNIKGEIVSIKPNEYLTIETDNGSSIVCDFDDIDLITIESNRKNRYYLEKGYRGFVYGEFICGCMVGGAFTTVHGGQINKHLYLGGGIGIRFADDWHGDHLAFPIFANFRYDFGERYITPFLDVRAGITLPLNGAFGFYGSTNFGCRIGRLSMDIGLELAPGLDEIELYNYNWTTDYYRYYTTTSRYVAFNCVTKIGFEF